MKNCCLNATRRRRRNYPDVAKEFVGQNGRTPLTDVRSAGLLSRIPAFPAFADPPLQVAV